MIKRYFINFVIDFEYYTDIFNYDILKQFILNHEKLRIKLKKMFVNFFCRDTI